MRVDAGITGSACEILVLSVGDVDVGLRVAVLLRQPKVDDVHLVGPLAEAHEEIVRLDIPVNEALCVHKLYAAYLR